MKKHDIDRRLDNVKRTSSSSTKTATETLKSSTLARPSQSFKSPIVSVTLTTGTKTPAQSRMQRLQQQLFSNEMVTPIPSNVKIKSYKRASGDAQYTETSVQKRLRSTNDETNGQNEQNYLPGRVMSIFNTITNCARKLIGTKATADVNVDVAQQPIDSDVEMSDECANVRPPDINENLDVDAMEWETAADVTDVCIFFLYASIRVPKIIFFIRFL